MSTEQQSRAQASPRRRSPRETCRIRSLERDVGDRLNKGARRAAPRWLLLLCDGSSEDGKVCCVASTDTVRNTVSFVLVVALASLSGCSKRSADAQSPHQRQNQVASRARAEQQLGAEATQKLLAASFFGAPTNVQFMIKDAKRYASTGGWRFAQFTDGQLDGEEAHKPCFACHSPAKDRDFVFTRYSP